MYALLAAATIPTPSPAQLRYMATDFIALIHFNLGTFAHNGDPCCDATNWDVKAPYAGDARPRLQPCEAEYDAVVRLDQRARRYRHSDREAGCGFLLWPTAATLPDGSAYGYNVGAKGAIQRDVLRNSSTPRTRRALFGFYFDLKASTSAIRTRAPTRAARRSSPASTTSRPTSTRRSSTRTSARSGRTTGA